jgi:hypothetical protein
LDKEEYFMVDCRKSIFLEIEGCDFMYSTDEKLYSLCVTAYVLNSFGITPMQLMTNVITLTRQNNSEDTDEKGIIEENTEGKEAVTADVLPGEQKYSEEEKLISDCKLLAGCLNYAKSNNRILEVGGYMLCMDTLDKVGSYANLYHNIYTYLTDVSKTKMISIIRQSKKKYESQHSNKKE